MPDRGNRGAARPAERRKNTSIRESLRSPTRVCSRTWRRPRGVLKKARHVDCGPGAARGPRGPHRGGDKEGLAAGAGERAPDLFGAAAWHRPAPPGIRLAPPLLEFETVAGDGVTRAPVSTRWPSRRAAWLARREQGAAGWIWDGGNVSCPIFAAEAAVHRRSPIAAVGTWLPVESLKRGNGLRRDFHHPGRALRCLPR